MQLKKWKKYITEWNYYSCTLYTHYSLDIFFKDDYFCWCWTCILSVTALPCSCYHVDTVFRTEEEICFVKSSIHTHRYPEMYTTWLNQPEIKYFDLFTLCKKHRFLCLRRKKRNLYWMSNILCRATHWCVKWKGMKSIRIAFPWKMSRFQNKEGKELRGPCAISCQTWKVWKIVWYKRKHGYIFSL